MSPRDRLRRFGSYGAVSVGVVLTSQLVLAGLVGLAGWPAVWGAVGSAVWGNLFAYGLYRRFVWQSLGTADLRRTILVFLALNVVGLVCSAVAVHVAESLAAEMLPRGVLRTVALNVASIGSYAGIWVARFVALDRLVRRGVEVRGSSTDAFGASADSYAASPLAA